MQLLRLEVHSYSAGRISEDIAQTMATTAARVLRRGWPAAEAAGLEKAAAAIANLPTTTTSSSSNLAPQGVTPPPQPPQPPAAAAARGGTVSHSTAGDGGSMEIQMHVKYESAATAVGDGGGLLLVAVMDSGARLGWAHPLEKKGGAAAEGLAQEGAQALLECLASGAAVDEW
jgi:hypothetical protein